MESHRDAAIRGELLDMLYPDPEIRRIERDCGYSQAVLYTDNNIVVAKPEIPHQDLEYERRPQLIGCILKPTPKNSPAELVIYTPPQEGLKPWYEFHLRISQALINKEDGKDMALMVVRFIDEKEPVIDLLSVPHNTEEKKYDFDHTLSIAAVVQQDERPNRLGLQLFQCAMATVEDWRGATNTLSLRDGVFSQRASGIYIPLSPHATIRMSNALMGQEVNVKLAPGESLNNHLFQNV